jgi:CPA2 family monovalent cation:H+ antiporter-2
MQHKLLIDILLLLASTVLVVGLFRRLRMPAIIGYLVVGALIGPHGFAWLTSAAEIRFMAELGIVFLMFMLGLEFSLPVLMASRNSIFGFGGSQVLLTVGLATGLGYAAGLSLPAALVVGGALAMSSTAIVLKQLTEQGELATRHGRLSISVLLFQDLATLPFLVAIPALAEAAGDLPLALLWTFVKATLVLLLMLLAGRWLIRPIIHAVARAKSQEFFVLATLLLILAAAAVADVAGLSLAIGAFLAGVVLGETPFKHYVEDEIRPFRDVLLGLFFVTIGMQLHGPSIVASWVLVAVLLLTIVVGKPLLILALAPFASTHPGVVLRTGICLGQSGEFGLLILTLALGYGLIDARVGQPVLAGMVLSMMVAPLLVRWNGFGVRRWNFLGYRNNLERQEERAARLSGELENHVIVCGYGRFGRDLVQFLELEGVPYIVLDTDGDLVERARNAHKRVVYGDAGRYTLLEAVSIERARAVSITFDNPELALRIVKQVRPQHPHLPILVRAAHLSDLETLEAAGASDALPEALETSLLMAAQLLLVLGVPHSRVEEHMDTVRGAQHRVWRGHLLGSDACDRVVCEYPETLRAIRIDKDSWVVGATLQDLDLESHLVTVVALCRASIRVPELNMDTAFQPHDRLVVAGAPSALRTFEARLQATQRPDDRAAGDRSSSADVG